MPGLLHTRNFRLWFICFIFSVSILLLILFLGTKGIYLQIGFPPGGIHSYQIKCLLIILILISSVYLIQHLFHNLIMTTIATINNCFIFSAILIIYVLHLGDVDYTTFSSPKNQENFVVVERGFGELYQMSKTGLFMKYLANVHTDDGYRPFSEGAYQLNWKEPNTLVIRHAFDYMSPNSYTQIVTLKYN
ncbi:hypothetical protein ACVNNN_10900 [Lysinibacillus fusiformis]|jgi:hypothetical protein|uniref:hypothetical protein n=1 Tax=Lysinibacillus sp. PWR01 TaxID=3342384 RepID=UPI00372D56C6